MLDITKLFQTIHIRDVELFALLLTDPDIKRTILQDSLTLNQLRELIPDCNKLKELQIDRLTLLHYALMKDSVISMLLIDYYHSLDKTDEVPDAKRVKQNIYSNHEDSTGATVLHRACKYRYMDIIKRLFELGCDAHINQVDMKGPTALHIASEEGWPEIVQCLLENGADINAQDLEGNTALHLAAKKGWQDIVCCLLDGTKNNAANVDIKNLVGNTALHAATMHFAYFAMELLLLNVRVDADIKNLAGDTPIHIAANNGDTESIKLLLEHGADSTVQNKDGYTFEQYGSIEGCDLLGSDDMGG